MLDLAVRNTNKLIRQKASEDNVRMGRFFTKKACAAMMADWFSAAAGEETDILDPGAGTGILSAAAVERLSKYGGLRLIRLTCYENDPVMLPRLRDNLERVRKMAKRQYGVKLLYTVKEKNFITERDEEETGKYAYVIMNPPVALVEKESAEATALARVCPTYAELACLFAIVAKDCLREGGQMVTVLPTTTASGAFTAPVRRELFGETVLERLHIFIRLPSKKGGKNSLRRQMVLCLRKTADAPETVELSVSPDEGEAKEIKALPPRPYALTVRGKDKDLLLATDAEDLEILDFVSAFTETLSSLGLCMHTGLTLESRYPDCFRDTQEAGTVPFIRASCIADGRVVYPALQTAGQYLLPAIPSLTQRNKNMLFIKRVPAKSDARRLTCGIWLRSRLPRERYVSTGQKLNYIDCAAENAEMDVPFLYGLYALLSSTLYDRFVTVYSSSSQINAGEMNALPLPTEEKIREIGKRLQSTNQLSLRDCDAVVNAAFRIRFT